MNGFSGLFLTVNKAQTKAKLPQQAQLDSANKTTSWARTRFQSALLCHSCGCAEVVSTLLIFVLHACTHCSPKTKLESAVTAASARFHTSNHPLSSQPFLCLARRIRGICRVESECVIGFFFCLFFKFIDSSGQRFVM